MSFKDKLIKRIQEKPSNKHELKVYFGFDGRLEKQLSKLIKKGKIKKIDGKFFPMKENKHNKKLSNVTAIEAVVVKHTGRFAFATPVDGGDDYFIPGRDIDSLLLGDRVMLLPEKKNGRESARVLSILQQHNRATGIVVEQSKGLAVQLDGYNGNIEVSIKKNFSQNVKPGEVVAINIISRDENNFKCEIKRRLGDADTAIAATKALMINNEIRTHFNTAIKTEISEALTAFDTQKLSENRIDLRGEFIFTIDGADTKDIDDAISIQKTDAGYVLGVHIADVSHYVKLDTALEREAYERQFSFYYPTGVVPMLPAELSNGLCSLSPNEDRLCFSCIMELSKTGELLSSSFVKTVIRSRFKGVYSEINKILDGSADNDLKAKYHGAIGMLKQMKSLSKILEKRRFEKGAIEFNLRETGFEIVDDKAKSIYFKERGLSESIIEEFMLMANNATASVAREIGLPILYRIHSTPNLERLNNLFGILSSEYDAKIELSSNDINGLQLQELLKRYIHTPLEHFVHSSILRCMAKAEYSSNPEGHFGLATNDYCHFTSPIRRYSDLLTHHVLSEFVDRRAKKEISAKYHNLAISAAEKANSQEQLFVRSERMVNDIFKAEAMSGTVGEIYEGIINGITEHAVYVLLENSAEGRILIEDMSEEYLLVDEGYRLYSSDGDFIYKIGDKIAVQIVSVQVSTGRIDMIPEKLN